MCLLSAVSLGLTLLMLFGVLHVGSPRCTCSGETDTLLFWINFRCESESQPMEDHIKLAW
ncbi:hypothetical protein pdam_00025424 [Pocillopora damicornis]|uniref:Uncharacterized protein n=1 Tax=Pocillopora damicornis TaxID=46731 RepID=A0A3M6UZC1_POCDA|nr:hypothetical protein pdam_00025424 [Pocillopora damicornis]